MKRQKLGIKALTGLSLLAIFLIVCTCFTVGMQYWKERMREYSDMAFSYARTAAAYIDGDRVLFYLETDEKDAYYEEVQHFLSVTQAETDIEYYYVFVPYENDLVYVWDSGEGEGVVELGGHESYMEGGKEAVQKIFRQNPPEEISVTKDPVYGYIAGAYSPVFNSAGEPVAVVGVDLSMPGIRQALTGFLIAISLSVVVVIIISMLLFYRFVKRSVIAPIGTLNRAAKTMVSNLAGETDFQAEIHTGDEIEELSDAFSQMNAELKDYLSKLQSVTAEKERIGAELDIARHIQSSMLPCIFPPFPERKEFDIFASMNPAKEVGGDFYDFFMVDADHLAVVMADVSGKGIPAALFMVIGKTLIKDHTTPGVSLGTVFEEVNRLLCDANSEGMFITAFEAVLHVKTGELRYVNAGHEPPYLSRGKEGFEPQKIRPGFVLAGLEDMRYREGVLTMQAGDQLFLYTDGVTEATNAQNEMYGSARLKAVLNRQQGADAEMLLEEVKRDVDAFANGAPQFDDITMLCLKYHGETE